MCKQRFDNHVISRKTVTPAKAGVHSLLESLDSRFRGNDRKGAKRTFYESIKYDLRTRISDFRFKMLVT